MTTPRAKIAVGVVLLGLAAVSFAASFTRLGAFALPLALVIATTKAILVLSVFMEVKRESASFKLALVAAGVLVATLLGLVATDTRLRGTPPLPPPLSVRGVM